MKKKPKPGRSAKKPLEVTEETMPGRRITTKDIGYLSRHCYVTTMQVLDPPEPIPKYGRKR